MAQKTNPIGFRLFTQHQHLSKWTGNDKVSSKWLIEDFLLRKKITQFLGKDFNLSHIKILRNSECLNNLSSVGVIIVTAKPGIKEMCLLMNKFFEDLFPMSTKIEQKSYYKLKKNVFSQMSDIFYTSCLNALQNKLRTICINERKINISSIRFQFVDNVFEDAHLISKFIALQLAKRVPYKRALSQVLRKVKLTGIDGLKITVAGRLNGIDIARKESVQYGKMPLHTINVSIDYAETAVRTVYGIMGIKTWLCLSKL